MSELVQAHGLFFGEESWEPYYAEAAPLWAKHYEELCGNKSRMPQGPDTEFYKLASHAGVLQIVTVRAPGVGLVGYQLAVIRRHTHYPVLCAYEDAFYLDPLYRKGLIGVKLLSVSIEFLKARQVKLVFFTSNEIKPTGRLFEFLRFRKTHTTYSKWIGED